MASKHTSTKNSKAPPIPAPKASVTASVFDALPDSAFVRQSQLVRNVNHPEVPVPLPFSAPTLWRMVKKGDFPPSIKVSARLTVWKVSEVRAWMASQVSK